MADQVRVRFAPSPTGHLHIGGARTALFNYLYARRQNGVFVLRLEDTDIERSTEASVNMILQDLRWLGLEWDEGPGVGGPYGPYRQMERMDLYRAKIEQLVETGQAYPCFCTPEILEAKRQKVLADGGTPKYDGTCRALSPDQAQARVAAGEPHVIRLKIPEQGTTILYDLIRDKIVFDNQVLDDFILTRTNGYPTYNFAAVVDDAAMKITHIIRGDDHLSNTPRQICLYQALREPLPKFAHVPMILGADKTRLSKRHGATSVGAYQEAGYLPEAMVNYLALLGWAFDDKTTLFTLPDLIEKFSLKKVSKNPAVFDPAKLVWINGVYVRKLDPDTYTRLALAQLTQAGLISESLDPQTSAWASQVVMTVKDNVKLLADVPSLVQFFFGREVKLEDAAHEKLLLAKDKPELFKTLHTRLAMLESFSVPALEDLMRQLVAETGVKFGEVVHPLRAAVTGRVNSPGIFEVLELLGQERVVERLAQGLHRIGLEV